MSSTAFGPLTAALRQGEAYHHDLEQLLPQIVTAYPLEGVEDIAAVLRYRTETTARSSPPGLQARAPRLIAGLIPEPLGFMTAEHRQAIHERKELIEARARALAEEAVQTKAPWTHRHGQQPTNPADHRAWLTAFSVVAAYRDRYGVTSRTPLGDTATTDVQRCERARAAGALREAQRITAAHPIESRLLGTDPMSLA